VDGFASGFTHPFCGIDHLLAMLGVGLWAALWSPRHAWQLPVAFVLVMVLGGGLGALGLPLAGMETGIAASVLSLGGLIATRTRLPSAPAILLTGLFALFHGYAHGLEMRGGVDFTGYAAGFLSATATLHLLGILCGRSLLRIPALYRACGALAGVAGMVLLAQM
jgi:urease accessory protein